MQKSEKRNAALRLIADDEDTNKLKVLIDGDGMKLLMDIYQEYVSDDDYVQFPKFMRDVDNLLLGARGGRPLTREERQEMNDAPPTKKRGKKKKKVAKPETNNSNSGESSSTEVTSSDHIANFVANSIKRGQ